MMGTRRCKVQRTGAVTLMTGHSAALRSHGTDVVTLGRHRRLLCGRHVGRCPSPGPNFGPHSQVCPSKRATAASVTPLAAVICNGAGDRNRTDDPVITSDVLYQLSYTSSELRSRPAARRCGPALRPCVAAPRCGPVLRPCVAALRPDGATPQNRTGDTTIFSRVLYQLS